jgi:hypothetical protein
MSYGGETDSKRIARYLLWSSIRRKLQERFVVGPHVVLCSSEAGDVRTLVALGADPKGIFAVDSDASALAHARAHIVGGGVNFVHGDVAEVATSLKPLAAFLDFCGPIGHATALTTLVVSNSIARSGVLAGGFMRGRDRCQSLEQPIAAALMNRRTRRFLDSAAVARRGDPVAARLAHVLLRSDALDPIELYREIHEEYARKNKRPPGWARTSLVRREVFGCVSAIGQGHAMAGKFRTGGGSISYQGAGVPMVYATHGCNILIPVEDLGFRVAEFWQHVDIDSRLSRQTLRSLVVKLARANGSEAAALALNLPAPKVRAWLAHDTMGTYSKAAV